MTNLVACLSSGKGSWTQLRELINIANWEKIFLITDSFGKENFNGGDKVSFVLVNFDKPIEDLVKDIVESFKDKIYDTEIALNIISGNGKEHMAILSAMLKLGLGIRLVTTKEGKLIEL